MKPLNIQIINGLIIFIVISLAGLSSIYDYQQLITFGFIPLLLLVGFFLNKFHLYSFQNIFSRLFLGIIILGAFVIFVSIDLGEALKNLRTLLGVYLTILLTIELLHYKDLLFLESFLLAFVIAFFLIAVYVLLEIGKNDVNITDIYIDRSQFELNANTYSYFSFFGNMALFYLIQLSRRKIYIILSFAWLILGIFLSFITASRSGLIFTAFIGTAYWLFIFDKFKINPYLRFLVAAVLIGYAFVLVYGIYLNSYLQLRVETYEQAGDPRERLLSNAINVFLDHPLTGVGPGQFHFYSYNTFSFSHNSFTEMAANMGIFGILFFIIILFSPFIKSVRTYFKYKSKTSLQKLNILFFFTFILINNIYVFYLTTYGMMFFFIIVIIQEKMRFVKNN